MRRTHPLSSGVNKFSAKLAPKYEEPLKIVEIKSPTVYIFESVNKDSRSIAKEHVSELKRYIPPRKAANGWAFDLRRRWGPFQREALAEPNDRLLPSGEGQWIVWCVGGEKNRPYRSEENLRPREGECDDVIDGTQSKSKRMWGRGHSSASAHGACASTRRTRERVKLLLFRDRRTLVTLPGPTYVRANVSSEQVRKCFR